MRIDTYIQGQNVNVADLSDVLSRLNVGDIIKAKIIEMTSNELLLKLMDGSMLKAISVSDIDAGSGEYIDLMVRGRSDGQLLMETVKKNMPQTTENKLLRQLGELKVETNPLNLDIAREMENRKLSLSKETFNRVLQTVIKFKDITPAKAAFLLANNLEPDIKNINALNQLTEGKFKISSQLDEILKLINKIDKQDVLKNISDNLIKLEVSAQDEKSMGPIPTTAKAYTDSAFNASADELDSMLNTLSAMDTKNTGAKADFSVIFKNLSNIIANNQDGTDKEGNFEARLYRLIVSDKMNISDMTLELTELIKDISSKLVAKQRSDSTLTNTQTVEISHGEAGLKESASDTSLREFGRLFIKLDPNTLKDDLNKKDIYKDIFTRLEAVKEAVQLSSIPERAELLTRIENTENNIRFMNDIYQNNTYMQIPISLPGRNSTAELYIMKREAKRKKIDPGNVTMLIALNTENLGNIETMMVLKGKNININMRVEDQRIINFLKENYTHLYTSLKEKGYKLSDLRYCLQNQEINLLNFNEAVKAETGKGKPSLDLRV